MPDLVEKETGPTIAKDANGIEYVVIETTTFAEGLAAGEPLPSGAGRTRLVTSHGVTLERIGKGCYRIAHLGIELKSDAPDAP